MRSGLLVVVALLAGGCVALDEEGRFPPHEETKTTEKPSFDNLVLAGTLSGGGSSVRLNASAHNQGPHTYKVSAICKPPWHDTMASRAGPVHHKEPMAVCEAFGLRDMKPGERLHFGATWEGDLWDAEERRFEGAPSGAYTWTVEFEVYKGGSGTDYESRDVLQLSFTVTVR